MRSHGKATLAVAAAAMTGTLKLLRLGAGVACDPETKKPIPCDGSYKPSANTIFAGRTAKELSVRILEEEPGAGLVTMMVHANYLGREFQRAEACLASWEEYVQD